MAKYFIFANAIGDGYLWLVLFAIAMSLVGVYYYFKIIIAMYFSENTDLSSQRHEGVKIEANPLQMLLIVLGCGLMLVLGLFPQLVYNVL